MLLLVGAIGAIFGGLLLEDTAQRLAHAGQVDLVSALLDRDDAVVRGGAGL